MLNTPEFSNNSYLLKRENFAVSLRKEKRHKILYDKRTYKAPIHISEYETLIKFLKDNNIYD